MKHQGRPGFSTPMLPLPTECELAEHFRVRRRELVKMPLVLCMK